jgi:hypothetical protein
MQANSPALCPLEIALCLARGCVFLSLVFPTHVISGGPWSANEEAPKGVTMHSAVFSCVSANAEHFTSVHYYIRNGMMLFHATSAESTCTSISLLTPRE